MKSCITIDVSQDRSHIQGFINLNKPLGKPKLINHNKTGFANILTIFNSLKIQTDTTPLIIFEYTGIYHKPLEAFLRNNKIPYHIIAPLRAAKARKNELRAVKTDKRDCLSLAKLFYTGDIGIFKPESSEGQLLKSLNRAYENNLKRLQEVKVNFRETLSVIYPCFKITKKNLLGAFKSVYSLESFTFLKAFPHPELIYSEDDIKRALSSGIAMQHKHLIDSISKLLFKYVDSCVSGCSCDSQEVANLLFYIELMELLQYRLNDIIEKMTTLVEDLPLFKELISMSGIKHNLAARFIAEAGDLSRFKNYKALIAFCGTDPFIFQSGDKTGQHLAISKKGNKHLRTILHLMVRQLIKVDSEIRDYYRKKTQQGIAALVASIACCNKLLRKIFFKDKTGRVITR
jgi:transposase